MREIFAEIARQEVEYRQLPLFKFMADKSIHPRNRLSFAPCAAPFIMSFADLNKYALRQEPTTNNIQQILNQHTYEDDNYWQWFLEDIEKLGFNSELKLNDSLRFIWSDESKKSRLLAYELYHYLAINEEPLDKLIILESIEATSGIFSYFTLEVTKDLEVITKEKFRYFGDCHYDAETGHNAHTDDVKQFLYSIQLEKINLQKKLDLVNKVFALFTQWSEGLLAYALEYKESQLYENPHLLKVA